MIRGRIHDGGELDPDAITIYAESPEGVTPRVHVQTRPDEDGRFLLVVPEGPVRHPRRMARTVAMSTGATTGRLLIRRTRN